MEFLAKFSYDDDKLSNSCSSESITSSSIGRKAMNLNESTIFAEFFLKLICKNWKDKFNQMNHCIDGSNTKNLRK